MLTPLFRRAKHSAPRDCRFSAPDHRPAPTKCRRGGRYVTHLYHKKRMTDPSFLFQRAAAKDLYPMSTIRTGKTVRMIKSKLSEAWEQPGAPTYLPTPLQGILYKEMHARVVRAKRKDLYSFPAGQVVGMINEETSVRDVMYRMQMEYLEAVERLNALTPT